MSARDDFYAPRRAEMADTGAYAGFLLGFFGAAPLGWTALTASFEDTGDATMGVIKFAGTLVVAGLALGAVGYVIGALSGRIWELRHRASNPRVKPEAGPDMATVTAAPPEETVAAVARAWQRQARRAQQAAPGAPDTPTLARFDVPDAVREFALGRVDLVRSSGGVIGRLTCAPGWRWSRHVGEALRTGDRHRAELAGYVLEGTMAVEFDGEGSQRLTAGTLFDLPATAHDFTVVGDTPCVALLFRGAEGFAPAAAPAGP